MRDRDDEEEDEEGSEQEDDGADAEAGGYPLICLGTAESGCVSRRRGGATLRDM